MKTQPITTSYRTQRAHLVINAQEMNESSVNKSNDIQIFIPGETSFVSIFSFSKGQSTSNILIPGKSVTDNLSIRELAEKIRQNQR